MSVRTLAANPPVPIDTVTGGRTIRELHVDGGTVASFLAVPRGLLISEQAAAGGGQRSLYLLVNGRLGGDFKLVEPKVLPLFQRAFTLSQQSASSSLVTLSYTYARDHRIAFRLSSIGNDVPPSDTLFDRAYMRRLYDYGVERGRRGAWVERPPEQPESNGAQ